MGLRYRLRRTGPRAQHRREHQRTRSGHRNVEQHRRAGVEGHSELCLGEIQPGGEGEEEKEHRRDVHVVEGHLGGLSGHGRGL